jgi:hypothetical protein
VRKVDENRVVATMAVVVLGAIVLLPCSGLAGVTTLAYWRFEPRHFLEDSSGNHHRLRAVGRTATIPVPSDDHAASAPGERSALFDGKSAMLETADSLDFSPYRRIRISGWIRMAGGSHGVLWEHGSVPDGIGAITAETNHRPGVGLASIRISRSVRNADVFPHQPISSWQHWSIEFNRDAPNQDVTRVSINGRLVGETAARSTEVVPSFGGGRFLIGGRLGGTGKETPSCLFQGKMDELKIEALTADPPVVRPTKLYILAGQSNALGMATIAGLPAELLAAVADVPIYQRGNWQALGPGSGYASDGTSFGPELSFGRSLARLHPNERIGLVKYAIGSTALWDDWNPANPGSHYAKLLEVVRNAIVDLGPGPAPEIVGVAWMQGESDALEGRGGEYKSHLIRLIERLRADLKTPGLRFVIGRITNDWPNAALVIRAQDAVGKEVPNTAVVPTDDLSTYKTNARGEQSHYDVAGMVKLGERFAAAMAAGEIAPRRKP